MMTDKDLAFFSPPQSAKGGLHTLNVILDKAALKQVIAAPLFCRIFRALSQPCKAPKEHPMTQNEDTGSVAPRPPDTFQLLLPMGLWCALPDTWANRRGAMIVLRG